MSYRKEYSQKKEDTERETPERETQKGKADPRKKVFTTRTHKRRLPERSTCSIGITAPRTHGKNNFKINKVTTDK